MLEAIGGSDVVFSVLYREEATVIWGFKASLVVLSGDAVVIISLAVLDIKDTVGADAVWFAITSVVVDDAISIELVLVVSPVIAGASVLNKEASGTGVMSVEPSSSLNNESDVKSVVVGLAVVLKTGKDSTSVTPVWILESSFSSSVTEVVELGKFVLTTDEAVTVSALSLSVLYRDAGVSVVEL